MKEWFFELLFVLSYSRKTQWAIILGALGYIFINLLGNYMLNNFHLTGILEPMTYFVKDKLSGKYDKAALGCLGSFWLLAIKLYCKDKKRFYNSW
jgi:hypothetical protein